MNWLRRTSLLFTREFIEFYSSKSWVIFLILPLFIMFLFNTVYRPAKEQTYRIAYTAALQPAILDLLNKSRLHPVKYPHLGSAKQALTQNQVDGVILPKPDAQNRYTLLVAQSGYTKAAAVSNALNVVLIRIYARPGIPQFKITGPSPKQHLDWMALPLWLIQIILTICLLQNTAMIAEEKERQTLHALLVSPMTLSEYLTAKIGWSTCLGTGAISLTWFLTQSPAHLPTLLVFGGLGSLVYSGLAVLLGSLAPNAIFARTTSTALYLFSSLPLMVSNANLAWKDLLNQFPTFLIMRGFEAAILPTAPRELFDIGLWLLGEFLLLLIITHFALKRKADL